MRIRTLAGAAFAGFAGLALAAAPAQAAAAHGHDGMSLRSAHHSATPAANSANDLNYGGGPVVTSPTVYVVYWGSQWGTGTTPTSDPSGEAALQSSFFSHAYGSGDTFFTSQTQYTNGSGGSVGHPSSSPLKGTWLDHSAKAPSRPTDAQLAAEAVKAAAHFGVSGDNIQIIVDSPHGVVPSGFKTQYCAWHDVTTNASGADVPYTNMPYITDAGSSCGSGFVAATNGVNSNDEGITIVGGHEYAETLTDPEAGNGWVDSSGAETGDKCAWISSGQGASAIIALNGSYYAVQSLWSNNFGGGAGNCVTFYASASNQH